ADDAHAHGAHGHHGLPHESPPAMTMPLIALAVGSVLAGYVGVPHALGGHNQLEQFLHPSFAPFETHGPAEAGAAHEPAAVAGHADDAAHEPAAVAGHADDAARERLELTLMGVSTLLAFTGIGLAAFFFLRRPQA